VDRVIYSILQRFNLEWKTRTSVFTQAALSLHTKLFELIGEAAYNPARDRNQQFLPILFLLTEARKKERPRVI
jgi:hypothetical protein